MDTVRELLKPLGRPSHIAKLLGIGHASVFHWIRDNRVPAKRVLELQRIAAEREIELNVAALQALALNGA